MHRGKLEMHENMPSFNKYLVINRVLYLFYHETQKICEMTEFIFHSFLHQEVDSCVEDLRPLEVSLLILVRWVIIEDDFSRRGSNFTVQRWVTYYVLCQFLGRIHMSTGRKITTLHKLHFFWWWKMFLSRRISGHILTKANLNVLIPNAQTNHI